MPNVVAYRKISSLYANRECIVFLLKRLKIARIEAAALEILTGYMCGIIGMFCSRVSIFKADPASVALALAKISAGLSQLQLDEVFKQSMELAAMPSTDYGRPRPQPAYHLVSPCVFKSDGPLSPNIVK